MSWSALLRLIADEVGPEAAERIATRARLELQGARLAIPTAAARATPPSQDQILAALRRNGWKVAPAAAELGVNPSTVYRAISKRKPPQQIPDPGPTLAGRLVR